MVLARWRLLCFLVVGLLMKRADSSQDIMKKMTAGFAAALDKCKSELTIPEHIMTDFYNFWREDYALVNREFGCVIMCMASKFDLITDDLKLHHGNAHDFAKTHGADDTMAKQLVAIIHECENQTTALTDECDRVLEIAKCFRTRIHQLQWAPSMEVVLEEVMTEIKQ